MISEECLDLPMGKKKMVQCFPHMTVMYANALYQRGFIREGHKVLQTLLEAAMNFENSKMYPGLPEYFDNEAEDFMHI